MSGSRVSCAGPFARSEVFRRAVGEGGRDRERSANLKSTRTGVRANVERMLAALKDKRRLAGREEGGEGYELDVVMGYTA